MRIEELGHIVLYVSDLERSANFYRDTLGFKEIARDPSIALFSAGRTHHELLLIEVGGEPPIKSHRPSPGLYHIGFKIGNGPQALRDAYAELTQRGVEMLGATDHGVTHSLYILDPDKNELELYADVSDEWKRDPKAVLTPARRLDLN